GRVLCRSEFGFARSLGTSSVLTNEVRDLARGMDDGRPALADGAVVTWAVVDRARVSFCASENYPLVAGASGAGPPAELARRSALVSYYGRGDNDAARAAWATQIEPARDPAEAAMVADLAAQAGAA